MNTFAKIKKSVFLAALILLLSVSALTYYLFDKEFENIKQEHFEQKAAKIHNVFEERIEERQRFLQKYLSELLKDEKLLEHIKNGDIDKIDLIAGPHYNSLKRFDDSIKILTFRTKEGITIYRAHSREFFGDALNKKRTIILDTDRHKRSFSGFEVGKLEITYRVTQPLFYKDEYIGNVEIGVDPKAVLKDIKGVLDVDIGVAAKNKFLEVMLKRDTLYIGEWLFLLEGNKNLEEYFSKNHKRSDGYMVDTSVELKNHNYEPIGFLILGFDAAPEAQKSQEYLQKLFWLTTLILSVFCTVLYYIFYKALRYFNTKANGGENFYDLIDRDLLAKALKDGRVVPYFQPIVDTQGKTVKYEALMRIICEDGKIKKVLSPKFFIKEAIRDDLYISLFQNMISKTLYAFSGKEETVSLNFLPDDLFNLYIMQAFTENIEKFDSHQRVIVEIAEAECAENFSKLLQVAKKLKEMDVLICIDDFDGSALSYSDILAIEPDFIKLKGVLAQKAQYESGKAIHTIAEFAKEYKIKTIAQFVENKETFEFLKKYGIDEFQGHYFGYPQELVKGLD